MNPQHKSSQNPAAASVQQANSVTNQQMCNGNAGGLLPNNMPVAAPSCFMNFPNQPFPLQNTMGQFPNGMGGFNPQQNFNPLPVNQFNPSQQQQQGQFFANNPMNRPVYNQIFGLPNQQAIMQSTIQNLTQLLQLQQNPNYPQFPPGNFPMFQNQNTNFMGQNPGFLPNQQLNMPNFSGPLQHNQGQQRFPSPMMNVNASNQFPNMGKQSQNPLANMNNLQNQIAPTGGPQNQNFLPNQMLSGPVPHANQGKPRFAPPLMDNNASRQIANTVQPQNPTNLEGKHGNMPANVNGGWAESQQKNFTGDKRNDASHKGFKPQFHHGKHVNNGNMNKNMSAVNSGPRNSTNFERKIPSLKYTEQEIKEWREARKKHFPKNSSNVTNQETMSRRQQLKEILAKQAELGVEVADIPPSYLSSPGKQNPRREKHERGRFKKGKFHKKRGTEFHNDRIAKKTRQENQDDDHHHQTNKPNNNQNEREPSLLQKLLTRDIKRDRSHLLQVFRFMAANSFFSGEADKSLRFPSVIVRETGVDVAGEPIEGGEKVVDMSVVSSDEEEGEIAD